MQTKSTRAGVSVHATPQGMEVKASGAAALAFLRRMAGLPETDDAEAASAAGIESQSDQEVDQS